VKGRYKVIGSPQMGYAVAEGHGNAIVYDLLTRKEAQKICRLMNSGVGPEWDAIEAALAKEATRA